MSVYETDVVVNINGVTSTYSIFTKTSTSVPNVPVTLLDHMSDMSVHLTASQNELMDALTATAAVINNFQDQLNLKAPLLNPTFVGSVNGITKPMVGLNLVDNTSDIDKPVSIAQAAADAVVLSSAAVDATTKANAAQAAAISFTNSSLLAHATNVDYHLTNSQNLWIDAITATSAEVNSINTKAPLDSPTFTGTVSGINKAMVGLGEVDDTSDINKPVSTAQGIANNLAQSNAISISTGNLNAHAADQTLHLSSSQNSLLDSLLASPVELNYLLNSASNIQIQLDNKEPVIPFGTIAQFYRGDKSWIDIDKTYIGLSNVDNTSDANKPISIATQGALDLKADISYVDLSISNLIDSAPAVLNTLNELALALGNDQNFSTTIITSLGTKATNDDLLIHTNNQNLHLTAEEKQLISDFIANGVTATNISNYQNF